MKKVFSLLMVLMLLSSILIFQVSADGTTLTIDTVNAEAGDTVDVNFTLANNPGLVALTFNLL